MLVYIYNCLKKKEKKSEAVDKKYSGIGGKKKSVPVVALERLYFISFQYPVLRVQPGGISVFAQLSPLL